ncbi:type II toxin-antitoxin system VapC family toxin [Pontixanthobacter sp.]|uniref:type II toxin-antitoxin system VapC family toxin n=1 Tax=Pontixanthobacter sp. TaxID=2792078 RepID=UPI003C7DCBD8
MILIDSSVWIDFFNGKPTAETDYLDAILGHAEIVVGDLILTEVLQGFRDDGDYSSACSAFEAFKIIAISDAIIAFKAASNYRLLRKRGITVRRTIDTLIATRCIEDGIELLFSDRDFDPFVEHFGLRNALVASS